MKSMNDEGKKDESDKIIYVHVRPGKDRREHPIGTIAIHKKWSLSTPIPDGMETYQVGYSAQHTKKDPWDGELGRSIAAGRAVRSKNPISFLLPGENRNELLIRGLHAVLGAVERKEIAVSRRFEQALSDTWERLNAKLSQSRSRNSVDQPVASIKKTVRKR